MALFAAMALAALPASAGDTVVFTIVARVQFAVPGEWKVISSKSDKTHTVFAFQVPNPADEGTPDSTDLVVIAYDLKTAASRKAYAKISAEDPTAKETHEMAPWACSTFSGMQQSTPYVIWDCNQTIENIGVHVRVAWPQLPHNPPDYDKTMVTTLAGVLHSVAPSPPADSSQGIVRRPH